MQRILFSFLSLFLVVGVSSAQTMPDGDAGSRLGFGGALTISDGHIYVGSAPIGWPTGSDPAGQVYEFTKGADGTWIESARIGASNGEMGDDFGRSITVDGDVMLVAAPGLGAVYAFERSADGWSESGKIYPGMTLPEDEEFGGAYARGGLRTETMARIGDTWLVASYNGLDDTGRVHVVHHMGTMWHSMGTTPASGAWSIASAGNMLIAGVPSAHDGTGHVMVYSMQDDGSWSTGEMLMGDGLTENAGMGRSLAVSGDRLFVGAPGHEDGGAVLVFDKGPMGGWAQTGTIQQPETEEGNRTSRNFGQAIAVSGNDLLVGASRTVFVYNVVNTEVAPVVIDGPEGQKGNGFGIGIDIEGDVLAIGAPDADYGSGLAHIFERGEDGLWTMVSSAESEVTRMESVTGTDKIECKEGLANGLFPCDGVDMLSMVSTDDLAHDRGANLNDVWGWTDPDTDKEYVLAGRTDGTSFIDISDPANPVVIGQVMRTAGSPGAWWRDIKTYQNYAYIVADGSGDHGMQVFDLTRLRDVDPADMPVDFDPDMTYRGVASSHNIIINEETGFGYAIGSQSGPGGCGGQLHMLDLSNPGDPQFVGCFTNPEYGGTHDAQCVIYRGSDADYVGREVCFNSNSNALILGDVTDKDNPVTITVAEYPNTAYTHQGWLSEDHNYFYMNDELDEMNNIVDKTRTLIWDMSDLDEPILVSEFYHNNGASDHNLYIRGSLMYQSNYQAGLRIIDITDRENPIEVGSFDTAPTADNVAGFAGSWSNYPYFKSGVIVVSSQAEGIFILRKQEADI